MIHKALDHDRSCSPGLLRLAATPTLALMALVVQAGSGGPSEMLGPTASPASPLDGMAVMYLLMAVLHLHPWLQLIAVRRRKCRRRPEGDCVVPADAPRAPATVSALQS